MATPKPSGPMPAPPLPPRPARRKLRTAGHVRALVAHVAREVEAAGPVGALDRARTLAYLAQVLHRVIEVSDLETRIARLEAATRAGKVIP